MDEDVERGQFDRIHHEHAHEAQEQREAVGPVPGMSGQRRDLGESASLRAEPVEVPAVDLVHGQTERRVFDQGDRAHHLRAHRRDEDPGRGQGVVWTPPLPRRVCPHVTASDVLIMNQPQRLVDGLATLGQAERDVTHRGLVAPRESHADGRRRSRMRGRQAPRLMARRPLRRVSRTSRLTTPGERRGCMAPGLTEDAAHRLPGPEPPRRGAVPPIAREQLVTAWGRRP